MRVPLTPLPSARSLVLLLAWLLSGCWAGCDNAAQGSGATPEDEGAEASQEELRKAREKAKLDAEYPEHGAVVGTELRVHQKPDDESTVVGWLRVGNRVRLGSEGVKKPGCGGRFRAVHPTGFVCDDALLEVRSSPIEIEEPTDEGWKLGQVEAAGKRGALVLPPSARDAPLPYDYYFVKEPAVPEYHRLPSRNEQRAALAKAARYLELVGAEDKRAADYLAGELEIGPAGTAVSARYLDRGFFVASNGSELRASRRFVRTTQGRYIKQAQLEPRDGHGFSGVELGSERSLPLAWTTRTSRLLIKHQAEDGSVRWEDDEQSEPIERQTLLSQWRERKNIGGRVMHVLETERGPRYLRAWFAAVARATQRPSEVPQGESWIHIDLDQQTLVLYDGDEPVFATLVSTGIEEAETPTGVFEIERKRITDTMANIGPDAGDDRYRIEDVPWAQYFERDFALHAAFWHSRFGLPRSHGCVNMAPADAHRVFQATLPKVPEGWHGLSTVGTSFRGSKVVVTD